MTVLCTADPDVMVTIGRRDGGIPVDLPADQNPGGLWFSELILPTFGLRYTYAPTSAWVPGTVLLAAVPDVSALALAVVARGETLADVETLKARLAAALGQWAYTIRVTATTTDADPADPDGAGEPVLLGGYEAQPAVVAWDDAVSPRRLGMLAATGRVSIPVNPDGAP